MTIKHTAGGTAAAGVDYVQIKSTTVLPGGQTEVTIPLNVNENNEIEGSETVRLDLEDGSGYVLGPVTSSTITIFDDDTTTHLDLYLPFVVR